MAAWRPAPEEWCVNEGIGHLIEAERRGFGGRIRTILGADNPELEGWDSAAVARSRGDCDRKPDELLDEFEPQRRDSVELVRSLSGKHLLRAGRHPDVGQLTVDELLHEWIHHDGNHLRRPMRTFRRTSGRAWATPSDLAAPRRRQPRLSRVRPWRRAR